MPNADGMPNANGMPNADGIDWKNARCQRHYIKPGKMTSIVCTKSTSQLWVKLKDLCPLQNKNERLKNKRGGMMASI